MASESIKTNPFGKPEDVNKNTDIGDQEAQDLVSMSPSSSQKLLKGDRLIAFSVEEKSNWSKFFTRHREEYKYTTGTVVLKKDWKSCNLVLNIRWDDGRFERLTRGSEHLAYGDRVSVLDRECVGPGTKVYLAGHPKCKGTVVDKRFLVTAQKHGSPNLIFEDVDAKSLVRTSYGSAYVCNKIVYHGWIGLTHGYRTRVHLRPKSDIEVEVPHSFSFVLDAVHSKDLVIGQEITLGVGLLRNAEFSGELGTNWFTNFLRYFNTTAIITDIEIEELIVLWVGKACNPEIQLNPFELAEAPTPPDIIPRDYLVDVQYLVGDEVTWMTPKSLWEFRSGSVASGELVGANNLVTRDKWISKWLKKVDWDRWTYPPGEDARNKEEILKKPPVLEVMYTRSVVDVLWETGKVTTMNAGDVIPIHAGSVWSDMLRFRNGSVVLNCFKLEDKERYGVIMKVIDEQTALVKWVTPGGIGQPWVVDEQVPLYDLDEAPGYDFISRINQSPLVASNHDVFKIGVVESIDPKTGQITVKLPGPGSRKIQQWPHELEHFRCDILYCPIEGHYVSWYEHVVAPSGVTQVTPEETPQNKSDEVDPEQSVSDNVSQSSTSTPAFTPKMKVEGVDLAPDDNVFTDEEFLPRLRPTDFRRAVENEVVEMKHHLPDGMWVEYYLTRGDIMSAVVTGPKDSVYEDFLFIFDIFLLEDFPRSEPHFNFRSMGVTILPGHFCKSGAVFLPEHTRLTENDFTFSYILNVLLEIEDFMAMPLEVVLEKDDEKCTDSAFLDPNELYKFVFLNVLDYTIALLKKPPGNWKSVIFLHYQTAMPKIIERYRKGELKIKRAVASIQNEKGDLPEMEKFEMVNIPFSPVFAESVKGRVAELEKLFDSMMMKMKGENC